MKKSERINKFNYKSLYQITKGTNTIMNFVECNQLSFNTEELSKKDLKAVLRTIKLLDLQIVPF